MSISLGGSSGIVWADSTTTSAANVTTKLSPAVTNTANTMYINLPTKVIGSVGIYANNTTYTTA